MSHRPKLPQRGKGDVRWGDSPLGGGGSGGGGGGATGYYMTYAERQDYQRQHPGRDPYLAQPGDTLASVAAEHGVPVAQVSELNGIASNARIRPGHVLALPGGSLQRVEKNGYAFGLDAVDQRKSRRRPVHCERAETIQDESATGWRH